MRLTSPAENYPAYVIVAVQRGLQVPEGWMDVEAVATTAELSEMLDTYEGAWCQAMTDQPHLMFLEIWGEDVPLADGLALLQRIKEGFATARQITFAELVQETFDHLFIPDSDRRAMAALFSKLEIDATTMKLPVGDVLPAVVEAVSYRPGAPETAMLTDAVAELSRTYERYFQAPYALKTPTDRDLFAKLVSAALITDPHLVPFEKTVTDIEQTIERIGVTMDGLMTLEDLYAMLNDDGHPDQLAWRGLSGFAEPQLAPFLRALCGSTRDEDRDYDTCEKAGRLLHECEVAGLALLSDMQNALRGAVRAQGQALLAVGA